MPPPLPCRSSRRLGAHGDVRRQGRDRVDCEGDASLVGRHRGRVAAVRVTHVRGHFKCGSSGGGVNHRMGGWSECPD